MSSNSDFGDALREAAGRAERDGVCVCVCVCVLGSTWLPTLRGSSFFTAGGRGEKEGEVSRMKVRRSEQVIFETHLFSFGCSSE